MCIRDSHHGNAIHAGHHDIDDGQMNLFLFDDFKPFHAIAGLEYHISLIPQVNVYSLSDILIILHDQNMICFQHYEPPCE